MFIKFTMPMHTTRTTTAPCLCIPLARLHHVYAYHWHHYYTMSMHTLGTTTALCLCIPLVPLLHHVYTSLCIRQSVRFVYKYGLSLVPLLLLIHHVIVNAYKYFGFSRNTKIQQKIILKFCLCDRTSQQTIHETIQ